MRILIVGCGDIARRVLPLLLPRHRVFALLREAGRHAEWRNAGAVPLAGDLDRPASLRRLTALSASVDAVLHFAPPPNQGSLDSRTAHLLAALQQGAAQRAQRGKSLPHAPRPTDRLAWPRAKQTHAAPRLIYLSTSGVYGDCQGACIDETRRPHPHSARGQRRVDAEQRLRRFGRQSGWRVSILRVPGIYASDRLPLERLRAATPILSVDDDVYTNHIHADDLAAIVLAALRRGRANRCVHASDDSVSRMGDWFTAVANAYHLPPPPRLPRSAVAAQLSPLQYSFMQESRRLANRRLKDELRYRLRYPTVHHGLAAAVATLASPSAKKDDPC